MLGRGDEQAHCLLLLLPNRKQPMAAFCPRLRSPADARWRLIPVLGAGRGPLEAALAGGEREEAAAATTSAARSWSARPSAQLTLANQGCCFTSAAPARAPSRCEGSCRDGRGKTKHAAELLQ